jgi:hypothetical protein
MMMLVIGPQIITVFIVPLDTCISAAWFATLDTFVLLIR